MNQGLNTKNYNKFSIDIKMLWLFIGIAIFAHFLIVGTPNNAIVYALSSYPGTEKK